MLFGPLMPRIFSEPPIAPSEPISRSPNATDVSVALPPPNVSLSRVRMNA
jgi:hypothetical protein